jgi:hypothetical protein
MGLFRVILLFLLSLGILTSIITFLSFTVENFFVLNKVYFVIIDNVVGLLFTTLFLIYLKKEKNYGRN